MSGLTECHYCNGWKDKLLPEGFMAKCCLKRCNKHYCLDCIRQHFNPDFEPSHYRKDTWICFNCQNKCTCQLCKNLELNLLERKFSKRKASKSQNNNSKQNEQSVDVQSVSNISMNTSKVQEPTVGTSFGGATLEVEVEGEDEVMADVDIHERMLIPADEILMMPFFMQKIAKRKNMFFDFMSKNYKGEKKESSKNKIQELITRALDDRKGDSDDMGIEPIE